MRKILFLIHDLGPGGAEKVLVNLVNNMDQSKFDITVMALFDGGVNCQFLKDHVHYKACFKHAVPGNSHYMKLLTPKQLYRWLVKDTYDVVVSYLEGPCARIISGCTDPDTKLVSWIHIEQRTAQNAARSFRSVKEATACYNRFDKTVCVSETVKQDFCRCIPIEHEVIVLYNTNESAQIRDKAAEQVAGVFDDNAFNWCGVGKLVENKGFDRMLRIQKRLRQEGHPVHFYALGTGPLKEELEDWCRDNGISDSVTFLGYQTNPYKYVAKCDLFVCASHAEGFSTAATEALIVGTPVCTVEVSGMKEMLGAHNEYGVVTENDEEALYRGIKSLLDDPARLAHYKQMAKERGKAFSTENTVRAVEEMLIALSGDLE